MKGKTTNMISQVEKNRIIRLKRQANYYRSRAENGELTKKQVIQAEANANAIAWAINMSIENIEHREKERIKHKLIDKIIKRLRKIKYYRLQDLYQRAEQQSTDLHRADVMDHERTYDGLQKQNETKLAIKNGTPGEVE